MQNTYLGSKIKNAKKVGKTIVRPHWSCFVKKRFEKTANLGKMGAF